MSVIAAKGWRSYGPAMATATLRLLTLVALVLMPFGMAGTSAGAQPVPANHAMVQQGHCDKQSKQDKAPDHSSQPTHCAMCAALPAAEPPSPSAGLRPVTARSATVAPFIGIELEIATPSPRRS